MPRLFFYYCVEYMCSSMCVCVSVREREGRREVEKKEGREGGNGQRAICRNQGSFSAMLFSEIELRLSRPLVTGFTH